MWIFLVLIYGLLKGTREIMKKKALEKNTIMEVLFFYTLISFLLVLPDYKAALNMTFENYIYTIIKSFIIFCAWICNFKAIEKMPVSLYGILDLSRVIFSTLLGTLFLNEQMTFFNIIGLILVSGGLLLLGAKRDKKTPQDEKIRLKYLFLTFMSCILNAISGTMDKVLMKTMNSSQLQFWYMFFLVLMYLAYILVTRTRLDIKASLKNHWIWLLSILFVIADRALFIANGMPESKITIMTLIKQSSCIVTIIGGKLVFGEKNILFKIFCACIIITGIVISLF